jgi:tRNA A-37 threonylcarbamoyl transferase component Bud32
MAKNYPTIGEYNQVIQQKGGNAFSSLRGINLIPSRTVPIKVYLFGSGAFAAVFKGSINGSTYAIRCFLTAEDETINRYKTICNYLKNIQASWKTDCKFLENEIYVNDNSYPILKMEWLSGLLINQFVSNHISDNNVLSELQKQLVAISNDLEKHKIGHGDLQCGNIIVTGSSSNFKIKLIDYDGMFVPDLAYKRAVEKGRTEFQHPKRTMNNFSPEMDRFSFWVMITALEALKIDKTLWREVMQGGFNTLDNFLFTIQDFLNPNQSALFNKLYQLNSSSLNFYLDKLKSFCNNDYSSITIPILSGQFSNSQNDIPTAHQKYVPTSSNNQIVDKTVSSNKYKIISNDNTALVLTTMFQKLGNTPLELDRVTYEGKTIIISNGKETKRITLNSHQNLIEIKFE